MQQLSEYIQGKHSQVMTTNFTEKCFQQNSTNVARYVDCVRQIIPKFQRAEEIFSTGIEFTTSKAEECLYAGSGLEKCMGEARSNTDEIFRMIEKEIK